MNSSFITSRPGVPQGNILGHSLCYANDMVIGIDPEFKLYLGNDQNKPYGLLSDPTSLILYLCKSD